MYTNDISSVPDSSWYKKMKKKKPTKNSHCRNSYQISKS